jgi:hypothetical protein
MLDGGFLDIIVCRDFQCIFTTPGREMNAGDSPIACGPEIDMSSWCFVWLAKDNRVGITGALFAKSPDLLKQLKDGEQISIFVGDRSTGQVLIDERRTMFYRGGYYSDPSQCEPEYCRSAEF